MNAAPPNTAPGARFRRDVGGTAHKRIRLAAALLLLAMLAAACTHPIGGSKHHLVTAEFPRAFNLFPGSVVRVAGVEVGRVKEVHVPEGATFATATMTIHDDVTLPADVRAVIVSEALLGERYVQLAPPYTGGPQLEPDSIIPLARTDIPVELDELFASLNDVMNRLPPEDVSRLVTNLATILEGRGAPIGRTLDQAEKAVDTLRSKDDEIVALASRLADLNQTVGTRDRQLGALIENYTAVVGTLAKERGNIDASLEGLQRMSKELGDLIATHRGPLEKDIATLTRVGQTATRNLDQLDLFIQGQAELYRGAQRVFDFQHNWLPLLDHFSDLPRMMSERMSFRLAGLCIRMKMEQCSDPEFWRRGQPKYICMQPLFPCKAPLPGTTAPPGSTPDNPMPFETALRQALDRMPELERRLVEEGRKPSTSPQPSPSAKPSEQQPAPGDGVLPLPPLGPGDGRVLDQRVTGVAP